MGQLQAATQSFIIEVLSSGATLLPGKIRNSF
jgi:hypothetical protein